MMCQNCGRNNANVMYKSVVNGNRTELYLCDKCANKMNIGMNFDFGVNDIFSSFFDDFGGLKMLTMPNLMGRENFMLPGFAYGYEAEDSLDELDGILEKNRQKRNAKKEVEAKETKVKEVSEVDKLKAELNECIKNEEYEKAAVRRDKIKNLEK